MTDITSYLREVPPLIDQLRLGYDAFKPVLPSFLQHTDAANTTVLGFGLAVTGMQSWYALMNAYKLAANKVAHANINLESRLAQAIERAPAVLSIAVPIIYGLIDPKGPDSLFQNHTIYSTGEVGIWGGSIAAACLGPRNIHRAAKAGAAKIGSVANSAVKRVSRILT